MTTIKELVRTYSGMIEFKDISEESYKQLMNFIRAMNEGTADDIPEDKSEDDSSWENAVDSLIEHRKQLGMDYNRTDGARERLLKIAGVGENEDKGGDKNENPEPLEPSGVEGKNPDNVNRSKKLFDERVQKLVGILKMWEDDCNKNPDEYEWRLATTKEFKKEYADLLNGYSINEIGAAANILGWKEERKYFADLGRWGIKKLYPMKVVKSEPKAEENKEIHESPKVVSKLIATDSHLKNWNPAQAEILKKTRLGTELTIKELADVVHLPYYQIQAWENCAAAPSSGALELLYSKFGKDFRDKITAAS